MAADELSESGAFLQIRLSETEFMASYLSVEPAAGIIDRAEGASVCIILMTDTVSTVQFLTITRTNVG